MVNGAVSSAPRSAASPPGDPGHRVGEQHQLCLARDVVGAAGRGAIARVERVLVEGQRLGPGLNVMTRPGALVAGRWQAQTGVVGGPPGA